MQNNLPTSVPFTLVLENDMSDIKDKRASKKLAKDTSVSKSKTTPVASSSASTTGAMPGPVAVDNPAFDKLHSIQKDWAQREWIETVNGSMKRIVDFLNKFGTSLRPSRPLPCHLYSRFAHNPLSPPHTSINFRGSTMSCLPKDLGPDPPRRFAHSYLHLPPSSDLLGNFANTVHTPHSFPMCVFRHLHEIPIGCVEPEVDLSRATNGASRPFSSTFSG